MLNGSECINDTDITLMTEYRVARWLNHYTPWISLVLAILGNGAALITILKFRPFTSLVFFVAVLSVMDTLTILFYVSSTIIRGNVAAMGSTGCQVIYFLINLSVYMANWTLVLMTTERFVAVVYPLKVTVWFHLKKSRIYILIVLMVLLFPTSVAFWLITELNSESNRRYCGVIPSNQNVSAIFKWMDLALIGLIPCFILTILNFGIIWKLHESTRTREEILNNQAMVRGKEGGSNRQISVLHRNLSVMLVTVSIAFIVLQLPITVHSIVYHYRPIPTDSKYYARYLLILNVVHTLNELNHALNFLFYFVSGRKFRQKFMEVFGCVKALKLFRHRHRPENGDSSDVSQHLTVSETRMSKLDN